jgi:hypothetical protein
MSNNSEIDNLLLGLGYAQAANAERDRATLDASIQRQRATNAQRQLMDAEFKLKNVSTDADLKRQRDAACFESNLFREQLEVKNALILEWMHSNEAFKRLAKQYGNKLGITDEQRTEDFNQNLVDVAEEDPKFADTKIGGRAKAILKK